MCVCECMCVCVYVCVRLFKELCDTIQDGSCTSCVCGGGGESACERVSVCVCVWESVCVCGCVSVWVCV